MSANQKRSSCPNPKDTAKISLKEKLPTRVADMVVNKRKLSQLPESQETLKFRMEIINPNGSKVLNSLRQVVLTVEPTNTANSVSCESSTKSIKSAEKDSQHSL